MGIFRLLLTAVLVMAVSSTALATPIAYDDGMVDGVLRTYRLVTDANHTKLDVVLLRDYELVTDFYPTIPRSFVDNALPYSRCLQAGLNQSVLNSPPECLSFFFQVTDQLFGQGNLRDGCISSRTPWRRLPGGQSWWHGAARAGSAISGRSRNRRAGAGLWSSITRRGRSALRG